MADEDHLDREVAVFGEITPAGVKGGAKSRAIAAFDRLVGSAIDVVTAPLEGIAKRERARQAVQTMVIEALGEKQLQHLHEDAAFAERAL